MHVSCRKDRIVQRGVGVGGGFALSHAEREAKGNLCKVNTQFRTASAVISIYM